MNNKLLIFSVILILFGGNAFAQSGGTFAITQSAIASGGGQNSAGGAFSLDGTIGQSLAGNALSGNPFAVTSGFWNFTPAAPSAANVNVGGRIITANGNGIRNVSVILTAPDGTRRSAFSANFGYYRFENVPVGETYIISVAAKKYTFSQPSVIYSVFEEVADLDFIADSQ